MKISVDSGKYTFVLDLGWKLRVLRYGEEWIEDIDGAKAIHSMMCELDAARLVLDEARKLAEFTETDDRSGAENILFRIEGAVRKADALTSKQPGPSEWAGEP